MLGWVLRVARSAVMVSMLVFLIPPVAGDATTAVDITNQAQQYLSALYVVGAAYDAQGSESFTLLLMGAGFLILARRVRRSGLSSAERS